MAADDDNGDGTSLFDIFSASPLKNNDEGSLDIYAGLDSTISDSTSKSCVSFRNCLDLYEEILTEEGTAKEATYNDLQVEYGKCQLQMKELMKKFKELQTQNLNLKNENQSLKKNISALIKTARVEISRKDEEINNLHQRLSEFQPFRNNKTTRISDVVKTKDITSRSPHLDDSSKTDHRVKSDVSKGLHPNTLLPNLAKEGKSCSESQNSVEKHCANGSWSRSDHQFGEGKSSENRRERKDIRHGQHSRGTDRTKKDVNSGRGHGESKNKQDSQRLQGHPEKHGHGEAKAASKPSKLTSTDGLHKSECSNKSSWEKVTSRERSHSRGESQNDKNLERQSERLQNTSREEQSLDKTEKKCDPKFKEVGKEQEHWRRSDRALLPHSKYEVKSYNSSKYHPDERRGREDCKRDQGISSHGFHDGRSSSSFSSSKTNKGMSSTEVSVTHYWENIPERQKAERHRTEERRKREREYKEENRHMRKDKKSPTERLQKTNKEAKKTTVDLKKQNQPKNDTVEVSNEVSKGKDKEFSVKAENGPSGTKNKDLKLSFMEKLNLTLSPAKKQPVSQDNQHQITDVPKSSGVFDSESSGKTKTVACVLSVSEHNTEETRSKFLEPKGALPAQSELRIGVPESKMEEENTSLVKSVENVSSEMLVCDTELSFSAPMEMKQTKSLFPLIEVGKTNDGATAPAPAVMDILSTDASQNFSLQLDARKHDGLDSSDNSEGMEMKVVPSTRTTESSASHLPSVEEAAILSANHSKDNPNFEPSLVDTSLGENKSCHLEPCLPAKTLVSLPQQTQLMDHTLEIGGTNSVYHDDENSVLSIDFNHLMPIPEAISPLNSPVRPIAKGLRMESPSPILLYNNSCKDVFPSDSAHSTSKNHPDLNKENQKPVSKFDKCTENSCKNSFLDELEEGEIRSDSEESIPQKHSEKSTKSRASAEVQNTEPSPGDEKNTMHSHKDNSKMSVKIRQNNNRCNKRLSDSSKTEKKDKTMNISTLEKILPIIPVPSSVWEIMHMLRMIGKHVRKNYMKFKVKFSLIQFHRIIESATLSFTSLIKYLDLSKICKSVTTLQKNLCDIIESNLKQVKKNGIVDRLFEQQQPDMKKKLWKFVDEQLDYLFEKLKKILVKFCDSLNFGIDNNEEKLVKKYKERTQCSNSPEKNMDNSNKEMQRKQLPKPEESVNYKSLLVCKKNGKLQDRNSTNINKAENDVKRYINTCFDNVKSSGSEQQSLELNCPSTPKPGRHEGNAIEDIQIPQHSELKPERSFEILTEQQTSSLTFNLVSDAQMGEIFKSLLQGSDLLDSSGNYTEKNEWELKTPEKPMLESAKCESTPTCTTEELVAGVASPCPKVISDDNWSLLSSEKGPSLPSGFSLSVHPDVLDENCMFEALSKDNVCSSEKNKPCISSILFEDLAVSLTVPSPLKSDGHLSFLKPEVLPSSIPEEVISAHFSEDALLEEEDASEQDIHLALESDNSSSKSSCSSWTGRSIVPGFQYHPNLPMHAVIMEKSNDHFIVKIRHAAPSTSPALKHSNMPEGSLASLPRIGKEAGKAPERESTLCQNTLLKAVEDLKNSDKNVDSSKSIHKEQKSIIVQAQTSSVFELLKDASSKVGHCDETADDCFGLQQVWEPKVPEKLEELPLAEKIPHSVEDDLPTTCIDQAKDSVTETRTLEELSEVTVVNLYHLEHSEPSLDQNAQISGSSLQLGTTDICIDLTQDDYSESKHEGSDPSPAIENLKCQLICVSQDNCKEEKMLSTNSPLKCIVETCIDLTSDSSRSFEVKNDALKSELPSNSDSLMLPATSDNALKKRKKCFGLNHSQKKQRKEAELTSKEKIEKFSQDSGEYDEAHRKKSNKKRDPAVNPSLKADLGIDSAASLGTFPISLSAKNVIKKKGEIVVSWTRNDDREILLECQKRMPSLKTFTHLAIKLNKNPNQVSERFQQLKKLFEKSKCR